MTDDARPSLAVLGAGRVFERFHLPALEQGGAFRLVAVCDRDDGRLAWARARLPGVLATGSLPELLAVGADAVLVLTPPATHAEFAGAALAAGLHVLVEKPMALTVADGLLMTEAAERARRHLQVGFTRRFRAPYRRLRTGLGSTGGPPAPGRVARARFELVFPPLAWGAHSAFLGDDRTGGGVLDDVLSHQADLLRWLFGAPVARARAESAGPARILCELELAGGVVVECVAGHGAYAEWLEVELGSGRTLAASGSALHESRRASGYARRLTLLGDRVALAAGRLLGRPNTSAVSFRLQLEDFARAVRGGVGEGAGPTDGVAAIAVVEACRRSLSGGGWERVG